MKNKIKIYFTLTLLTVVFFFTSFTYYSYQTNIPLNITGDSLIINENRFDVSHYVTLSFFSGFGAKDNEEYDKKRWSPEETDFTSRVSYATYYMPYQPDSFFVSPPPANSSEQTKAEIAYLLALQKNRTPSDIARILEIDKVVYGSLNIDLDQPAMRKPLFYIGKDLGAWYSPENLPATSLLLARVITDLNQYIDGYKTKFMRIRPWVLEPQLETISNALPFTAAYPSQHAAYAYTLAYVLMELAPGYKEKFLTDAIDFAWAREQAGLHYPSDTEASRRFCRLYVNKLFSSSPKFKTDFEKAKEEWFLKSPK